MSNGNALLGRSVHAQSNEEEGLPESVAGM